jgi:PadR family transcriptional regulator, regulatory protein PadR
MPSMAKQTPQRANLLQGTLDMLVLRTLLCGPAHGDPIGRHISADHNRFSSDARRIALRPLEQGGRVTSRWEMARDRNREFKYYGLTNKGRKGLVVEESQ